MTQPNKYIVVLILYSLLLTFPGCRPKGILHSWEMRRVLVDLHKTDAMMRFANIAQDNNEPRTIYYAQVLEKHGITQAEFDSSLVWYTAHPQLFDKIYPRVLKDLKAQQEAFLALHEVELNLVPEDITVSDEGLGVSEFTRSDLDSVLWVTQHGYPHSWNPLVHDLVDQLFPQIGVLR